MKKYSVVGNKKKVTMETNNSRLKVVGSNCLIFVSSNEGEIEVIGNHCRVEVQDNYGAINLVGDGGLVSISRRWRGDKVQVVGPNCQVMVNGKDNSPSTFEAQLSPFSKELDDVIESIFSFVMR